MRREKSRILDGDTTDFANREKRQERRDKREERTMTTNNLLPDSWIVPQKFRDRLGARVGRQRLMQADGQLLLVLHAPPAADENERHGRFFWRDTNGDWVSKDLGTGDAALKKHIDEYFDRVEEIAEREDEARGAAEYFEIVRDIAPLLHAAGNLHRTLQEAREAAPDDRNLIDGRDRAYQLHRNAELLFSLAKEALEFEVAHQSEILAQNSYKMSVSSHRLNLLAAFFFPLATLSSLFGMGFPTGYEDFRPPLPFLGIIAVGLLIGVVLHGVVSRGGQPKARQKPPRY